MTRKFLFPLAALVLLAALLALNACQKDVELTSVAKPTDGVADQRNQLFYGVTEFSPGKPSQLVEIDQNSGQVTNVLPMQADLGGGNFFPLDDVRGICYMGGGKYMIMTGFNPIDFLNEALLDLDVASGNAYYISTSTVGPISDIDYDPVTDNIYGLQGTRIVTINGPGFTNYNAPVQIQNLPFGYTPKGLTMIGDVNLGTQVNIALTRNAFAGTTFVYKVNPATGQSGFIAQLLPDVELQGGNCALSYQLQPASEMYINRNTATVFPGLGLNRLGGWPNQGVIGTGNYGGDGFNYEDLSSDVGL
ncbi:MAG: hypothetical protein IT259_10760 [Saprospiraceae bacterium]|nr:hypothetical protein [Saprospiraceae bacterium]